MPDEPEVPPMLAGRLTLSVRYLWTGDAAEGARWFAPMREAAPVILDDVSHRPYAEVDAVHTDPVDPMPVIEAATVLTDFPAEAVDALLALTGEGAVSPQVLVEVRQMGGEIARPGRHESAFCAREAAYALLLVGIAEVPGVEAHAAEVLAAMAPWTGGHRMPNFTFEAEDYRDAYDSATTSRLRRAVRRYDPQGVIAIGHALDD
jgi:hypothetical protein